MMRLGERSLRRAVGEYLTHFLGERNHQELDNRLLEPSNVVAFSTVRIQRRERLGGMLRFHHREAA